MPVGGFLDSLPAILFISAHIIFLLVGIWAAIKVRRIFWLYALSQLSFLASFGNIFTLKLAVLVEQTLLIILVIWIIAKPQKMG